MSNDSSERSSQSRDGHTQSAPSTQRSTSLSVRLAPSGPSDISPQWKVPLWVHCDQCFVTYDINPSLKLLSCGHILCAKCLHLEDANLRDSLHVPCVRCSSETYVSIGSLDSKMQGMFQQCWMDPVLQLDVSNINFMMSKQESYNKYLFKKIKEGNTLPPEWQERQNRVKATIDRITKLKKMEQEIAKKTEAIKAETTKVQKNVCRYRSIYEKAKEEYRRKQQQSQQQRQQQGPQQRQQQGQQQNQQQRVGQQQQRQQQGQQQRQQQGQQQQGQQQRQQQLPSLPSREVEQTRQTHDRNEMKTISSFHNEQSNQDIGQLKSSSSRPNLNQSAPDIRNISERIVPPARLNQSLDEPRGDSTRCIPGNASHRSAMPTLRPWPKSFNADNRRAPDISDFSQRVVSPARLNQSLDEPREDSPRRTPDNASHRSTMPTLRQLIDSAKKKIRHSPLPKSLNEDNRRFEPAQRQALKRLIPSSAYDQYTNPPKRAAQHAGPVDLNTSKSSIDS